MRREAVSTLATTGTFDDDYYTAGRVSENAKTQIPLTSPAVVKDLLKECSVCGEPALQNEFVKLSACTHEPDTCKECFLRWIDSQFEITTWERMQCPSSGCNQNITHDDVQKDASDEVFTRYVMELR